MKVLVMGNLNDFPEKMDKFNSNENLTDQDMIVFIVCFFAMIIAIFESLTNKKQYVILVLNKKKKRKIK